MMKGKKQNEPENQHYWNEKDVILFPSMRKNTCTIFMQYTGASIPLYVNTTKRLTHT